MNFQPSPHPGTAKKQLPVWHQNQSVQVEIHGNYDTKQHVSITCIQALTASLKNLLHWLHRAWVQWGWSVSMTNSFSKPKDVVFWPKKQTLGHCPHYMPIMKHVCSQLAGQVQLQQQLHWSSTSRKPGFKSFPWLKEERTASDKGKNDPLSLMWSRHRTRFRY